MNAILSAVLTAAVACVALAHSGGAAAADVGVTVQISQPGVYGRIDVGRFPQPQVVMAQPVVILRPVVVYQAPPPQPIYMWVPPGHRQNWRKHCGQYRACGVPVYFVQDQWYGEHVRGRGREREREYEYESESEHGKEKHKYKYKEKEKEKGHGKGKGKHDD